MWPGENLHIIGLTHRQPSGEKADKKADRCPGDVRPECPVWGRLGVAGARRTPLGRQHLDGMKQSRAAIEKCLRTPDTGGSVRTISLAHFCPHPISEAGTTLSAQKNSAFARNVNVSHRFRRYRDSGPSGGAAESLGDTLRVRCIGRVPGSASRCAARRGAGNLGNHGNVGRDAGSRTPVAGLRIQSPSR